MITSSPSCTGEVNIVVRTLPLLRPIVDSISTGIPNAFPPIRPLVDTKSCLCKPKTTFADRSFRSLGAGMMLRCYAAGDGGKNPGRVPAWSKAGNGARYPASGRGSTRVGRDELERMLPGRIAGPGLVDLHGPQRALRRSAGGGLEPELHRALDHRAHHVIADRG